MTTKSQSWFDKIAAKDDRFAKALETTKRATAPELKKLIERHQRFNGVYNTKEENELLEAARYITEYGKPLNKNKTKTKGEKK